MALITNNFAFGRSNMNCLANSQAPAIHTYKTTDASEDVLVPGYFNGLINPPQPILDAPLLMVGDKIYIFFSSDPSGGEFIIQSVDGGVVTLFSETVE